MLGGSGIAAGVIALAIAGVVVHERGVVEDRRSDLAAVEARLVAAEAKAARVRAAQAASTARLAAVREVIERRVPWEDVMHDLSRVLPANVWLQSMTAASPGQSPAQSTPTAPGQGAAGFSLIGFADSQARVAQVLDRLELLPWLEDVTLQSSVRGGGGAQTRTPVQFTISASVRAVGGR